MEVLQRQEVVSPTSPVVEAFTPTETVPNSTEVASDTALHPMRPMLPTQPQQPCNVITASLEELQAELRQLQELVRYSPGYTQRRLGIQGSVTSGPTRIALARCML